MKLCAVCGWRRAVAKGRCRTCYVYLWRTGRDRPEELVTEHGKRVLQSILERKAG